VAGGRRGLRVARWYEQPFGLREMKKRKMVVVEWSGGLPGVALEDSFGPRLRTSQRFGLERQRQPAACAGGLGRFPRVRSHPRRGGQAVATFVRPRLGVKSERGRALRGASPMFLVLCSPVLSAHELFSNSALSWPRRAGAGYGQGVV